MHYKLGFENSIYIGTAGTAPSTALTSAKDVTIELQSSAVDATARNSGAFKIYIPGMIDSTITLKVNADQDDTTFAIIRSNFIARTAIAVKVTLGDGYYFMSDAIVDKCSNSQNTENLTEYDVSLKPTITTSTFVPTISSDTVVSGS